MMKRISRKRWLLVISSVAVAALLLAGLTCYFFPQLVLTVDSGPVQADVLVVLGGALDRPQRAAELFQAGEASLIICSGYGDAAANEAYLTNSGVPMASISLEPQSTTTQENAQFSIPLLHALGARRVIIVTSWFHSRRALACFEHYEPDIKFYSRPSYFGYPRPAPGAGIKALAGSIKSEYLKLLGYWVCYGVCPL